MGYIDIMRCEQENPGRVFLYYKQDNLVAYQLSAYVVKQLFPRLRLTVSKDADSSLKMWKIVLPFDSVLEKTEYPLAVSNDYIELTLPGIPLSTLAVWKNEFENYKENR